MSLYFEGQEDPVGAIDSVSYGGSYLQDLQQRVSDRQGSDTSVPSSSGSPSSVMPADHIAGNPYQGSSDSRIDFTV